MRNTYILFVLSLLTFCGCVEEYQADIPEGETNILVVDGTIFSDSLCTFYLSRTIAMTEEDIFHGENNAVVQVAGTDGSIWKGTQTGEGEYQVEVGILQSDVSYRLEIQTDGKTYVSEAQPPLEKPALLQKVVYLQNEAPSGSLFEDYPLTVSADMVMQGARDAYYRLDFCQDWEIHAEWDAKVEYNRTDEIIQPLIKPVSVGWKHEDSDTPVFIAAAMYENGLMLKEELFHLSARGDRLSYRHCTTARLRAISQKEYEYEKVRSQTGTQMGGIFSQQPSTLPSNIKCSDSAHKAIGFVGVCLGVQYKQLYINTNDIICIIEPEEGCQGTFEGSEDVMAYNAYYDMGYRPISDSPMLWAPGYCVDVRMRGASLDKPVWWVGY